MAINETSRYRNSLVMRVQDADGVTHPTIYHMVGASGRRVAYQTYVVGDGDRFDLLAARLLGDPLMWWVIADLNPEFFFAEQIPPGTTIRVPVQVS